MRWCSALALLVSLFALGCDRPTSSIAPRNPMPVVGEAPPAPGSAPRPGTLRGDGYSHVETSNPYAVTTLATGDASTGSGLRYDNTTEVTITGPIVGKREVRIAGDEQQTALVIRMKRENEIIPVYIAPTKWLSGKGLRISVASRVTVTGSQVLVNGEPAIMARTINLGFGDVDLRDTNGSPFWHVPTY